MEKSSFSLSPIVGSPWHSRSPAGSLSHQPSPPPPPLPPDPPNLDLSSANIHSPSSSSPPRTRAKHQIAPHELISTRPPRSNPSTTVSTQLQTIFTGDNLTHFPPLPPSISTRQRNPNPFPLPEKSEVLLLSQAPLSTIPKAAGLIIGPSSAPGILPLPVTESASLSAPHGCPPTGKFQPISLENALDEVLEGSTSVGDLNPPATSNTNNQNWANIIKASTDKSLKKQQAPISTSPSGVPRVKIPEAVFKKGAELHKDFIKCFFLGTPPSIGQIQSVLNFMWGKGKKLEIHVNKIEFTMLVRIPSDYIRQKVLEKEYWHIGSTMIYVTSWSSPNQPSPSMESIPIWAHVKGIHFDLMHRDGLSYIAGLIGLPIEMDDWTLKLSSTCEAHLRIKANLTKPLPPKVEAEREDGTVLSLSVDYPWVPPFCSHCNKIGHILKSCPLVTRVWKQVPKQGDTPNAAPTTAPSIPIPPSPSKVPDSGPSSRDSSLKSPKKPNTPHPPINPTLNSHSPSSLPSITPPSSPTKPQNKKPVAPPQPLPPSKNPKSTPHKQNMGSPFTNLPISILSRPHSFVSLIQAVDPSAPQPLSFTSPSGSLLPLGVPPNSPQC